MFKMASANVNHEVTDGMRDQLRSAFKMQSSRDDFFRECKYCHTLVAVLRSKRLTVVVHYQQVVRSVLYFYRLLPLLFGPCYFIGTFLHAYRQAKSSKRNSLLGSKSANAIKAFTTMTVSRIRLLGFYIFTKFRSSRRFVASIASVPFVRFVTPHLIFKRSSRYSFRITTKLARLCARRASSSTKSFSALKLPVCFHTCFFFILQPPSSANLGTLEDSYFDDSCLDTAVPFVGLIPAHLCGLWLLVSGEPRAHPLDVVSRTSTGKHPPKKLVHEKERLRVVPLACGSVSLMALFVCWLKAACKLRFLVLLLLISTFSWTQISRQIGNSASFKLSYAAQTSDSIL